MKKFFILGLAIVAVALSGCELLDQLFYNADPVAPTALPAFTGEVASTKDEIVAASTRAVVSAGTPIMARALSPLMPVIRQAFPTIDLLYRPSAASSRVITPTGELEFDANGNMNYSVVISDESFQLDGLVVNGTANCAVTGMVQPGDNIVASGDLDMHAVLGPMGDLAGAEGYLKAKGNVNASINSTNYTYTADGSMAVAFNIGVSVNATDTHKGGKFIISFKLVQSLDLENVSIENASEVAQNFTLEVTVKVYDNANKLLATHVYTQADLEALLTK